MSRSRATHRNLRDQLCTELVEPVSSLLTVLGGDAPEFKLPELGSDEFNLIVTDKTRLAGLVEDITTRGDDTIAQIFGDRKFATLNLGSRRRGHVVRDAITAAHAKASERRFTPVTV